MTTFRAWLDANTEPPTPYANGLGATLTAPALVARRAARITQPWESPDDLLALLHGDELAREALADARELYESQQDRVTSPPLIGSETWLPVMEAADYRCWCTGACGSKHTVSAGHCDHVDGQHLSTYGPSRLIADPADLSQLAFPGSARRSTALVAWCVRCYDGARRKAQREAKAAPELTVPLFDLPGAG